MAKYKVGQKLIRKDTNQLFTIKKVTGLFKHRYLLEGPHPSLDLDVRKSEIENLFLIASEISRIRR